MKNVQILCGVLFLVLLPGCFLGCFGPVEAEDFDTELAAWREQAEDPESWCHTRFAGECSDGRLLFLYEVEIDASWARFFDADTGELLGHDDRGAFCGFTAPLVALRCLDGVITEVFCGPYELGDAFTPYRKTSAPGTPAAESTNGQEHGR